MRLTFDLTHTSGLARAGVMRTFHGEVRTPTFMPVGTQASVKTLTPEEVAALGAQVVLGNTYHLYLRPGVEVIERAGGLHRFMGWSGSILTDSGGFQVFSLGSLRRVEEEGVWFRSHVDGSQHFFTPELVTRVQEQLGGDIAMVFDECAAYPCERSYAIAAMERTHRWAERCQAAHRRPDQALFGIVQGATDLDLRHLSARYMVGLDLPGYGIGGLSVGEPKDVMYSVLEGTTSWLPSGKPRYLMGVGSPEDLVEGVGRGVDMFDCVLPTRVARNGAFYMATGRHNIRNAGFRLEEGPLEEGCDCYTCCRFSRAYVHHLFRAEEMLAYRLLTIHNLRFLVRLMEGMRQAIVERRFDSFRQGFWSRYRVAEAAVRVDQRQLWLQSQGRTPACVDSTRGDQV